jgi:hypothetical protein
MDEARDTIGTPSPNIAEDYSDLGSTKSEEPASDRTKHQRGGRKQDDLGSTNSDEPASDRKKYQRGGRKEDTSRWNSLSSRLPPLGPDDESDREEEQEKEPSRADEPTEEREPRPRATPFKTGISSFNLKRAEGSGGRPMGVTIDDPTTKVPAEHEFDQERRKTTPDKGKLRTEREERQHMEPEEKKPVQIRLDLNLMIEVFLRAKIQGDVTITFL